MLIRYLTTNFPEPKPAVGDPVMRSQFVTGWLPESRPHFATLNNGENPVPAGRKAAVNAPQSRRFARFGDVWWSRQSRIAGECGGFSTAF
jgi:hypothetical protein